MALLAAAAPARADGEVATYRAAIADGERRFRADDFPGAREAFERAYAIHPEPLLLFNIASTFRREGDDALALQHYQRFLEEAGASDPRRPLAQRTIAELEQRIAAHDADPGSRASPAADTEPGTDRESGTDPEPGTDRESDPDPDLDLDLDHDHHHAQQDEPGSPALRWAGVAAGAAAVGAFTMAYLAARDARDAEAELERRAPEGWGGAQSDLYARGEGSSQRAWLWGATGGALAVTGVVLFVVGGRF